MNMTTIERARRTITALREPDASFAAVPNTVRQSVAEVIEVLITPVGSGREICECPKCGRNHWQLASPPAHIGDECAKLRGLVESFREILDECQDDFHSCERCGHQDDNATKESDLYLLLRSAMAEQDPAPPANTGGEKK